MTHEELDPLELPSEYPKCIAMFPGIAVIVNNKDEEDRMMKADVSMVSIFIVALILAVLATLGVKIESLP